MVRVFRIGAAALFAVTLSCPSSSSRSRTEADYRSLDLVGGKGLRRTGDELLPAHDAHHPPVVRIRGPRPSLIRLALKSGGQRISTSTSAIREIAPDILLLTTSTAALGLQTELRTLEVTMKDGSDSVQTRVFRFVWLHAPPEIDGDQEAGPSTLESSLEFVRTLHRDARSGACRRICRDLRGQGELKASAHCYRSCASVAHEAGWPSEAVRHRFAAAFVFHQMQDLEAMAVELDRAQSRMRGSLQEDPDLNSGLDYYRALLSSTTADHFDAREAAHRAATAAREAGLDLRFVAASMLEAEQSLRLGNLQHGLKLYRQLQPIVRRRAPFHYATWLTNYGWALVARMGVTGADDDEERARDLLSEALKQSEEGRVEYAAAVLNLAELELNAARPDRAQAWLAAFDGLQAGPSPPLRLEATLLRGEAALESGHPGDARRLFEAVIRRSVGSPHSGQLWRARAGLARVLLPDDESAAREQLSASTLAAHRGVSAGMSRPAALLQHRHRILEVARQLLEDGKREQALVWAEAAMRVDLDRLRAAGAIRRLSAAERRQWRRRVSDYRKAERSLTEWIQADDERSGLELQAIRGTRRRLEGELRRGEASLVEFLANRASVPKLPSSVELQGLLGPVEAALVLVRIGSEEGTAIVVTSDRISTCRALECTQDVAALSRAGIKHAYLMTAAGPRLPAAAAGIDLVSILEYVNLSRLPSLSMLAIRPPSRTGPRLVVGDTQGDLPRARVEARMVARARSGSELLLGDQATASRVSLKLRTAAEFHFSGHGQPADAPEPGLRLAGTDVIGLAELLTTPFDLHLAFLSGCHTAAASIGNAATLPEVFLLRETKVVVATHDALDDDVGRAFADRFYRALDRLGHDAPASAFRAAMREVSADRGPADVRYIELFGYGDSTQAEPSRTADGNR